MIDPERFITPAAGLGDAYFANAASGLAAAPVLDAVIAHLRREAEIGAPFAAAEAEPRLADGYAAAARLIGAQPDEIAFLESGNRGLQALILSVGLLPGDHVLVDRTCWGGTLDMLASLPGLVIDVMPVDAAGRADPTATRATIHPRTRLVILTWCPATGGTINPAAAIGAIAAETGAFYIVDACQRLGQGVVDVAALSCHGLVASGRKWLRGPRGTALLHVSRAFLDARPAFMADQLGRPRTDARRYEQGEAFIAGRLGLGRAIEGALAIGPATIEATLVDTARTMRNRLSALRHVRLLDAGEGLSAIVSFTIDGVAPAILVERLRTHGVMVSALSAAYTPLDLAARRLDGVVRAAPHLFTTEADITRLVDALATLGRAHDG